MKSQTVFAWLVVAVSLVILSAAFGPILYATYTHGPHVDVSLPLAGGGIACLFLGGWLLPESNVGRVLKGASGIVGPYLPTFGRRANSGEAPPPDKP